MNARGIIGYFPDTPTFEGAIRLAVIDLTLGGYEIESASPLGNGEFLITTTEQNEFLYDWSHTAGTQLLTHS